MMTPSQSERFTRNNGSKGFFAMLLSFIVALSLIILPLPLWMKILWPLWGVLFLIFWTAYLPGVLNPWFIFLIGLSQDVLQGSLLGMHALALLVSYLITCTMSRQIKSFPLLSQMSKVAIILIAYQIVLFALQGFYISSISDVLVLVLPLITSLILWPWILFLLHTIAVKFYIHRL